MLSAASLVEAHRRVTSATRGIYFVSLLSPLRFARAQLLNAALSFCLR